MGWGVRGTHTAFLWESNSIPWRYALDCDTLDNTRRFTDMCDVENTVGLTMFSLGLVDGKGYYGGEVAVWPGVVAIDLY